MQESIYDRTGMDNDRDMTQIADRTRVVVSLDAIRNNYDALHKQFPDQMIMSVLKANAYGHSAQKCASECKKYTDAFAVATLDEGIAVRNAQNLKPILVLGPVPEAHIYDAATNHLTLSIGSIEYAKKVSGEMVKYHLEIACHIKIDTGFNRTGFRYRKNDTNKDNALKDILSIYELPGIRVSGTYTHLPVPESKDPDDIAFTNDQINSYCEVLQRMKDAGVNPGITHALSTGGSLARPDLKFDMIRVGMPVYGQCDTLEHYHELGLKQAIQWTANLVGINDIQEGESVGYGRIFKAEKPMRIGTVSCGYADGYRRCYQDMCVLCGGKRVPIVGRICMDFMMIDLSEVKDPYIGMEVVLIGKQMGEDGKEIEITAIEIAEKHDSTCGEVTAAIGVRVPRYTK